MKLRFVLSMLLTMTASVLFYSCKEDDNEPLSAVVTSVSIANNTLLGDILVDNLGNSLYIFTKDIKGVSACNDGCLNSWPIFYVENITVSNDLLITDFNNITREDGLKQTTYKGWPLYYYSPTKDGVKEAAAATGGDAINSVWYIAKPNYSLLLANTQLVGHDGKNYTSTYEEGEGETAYLVDANGKTLYAFSNDTYNNNTFTAADLSNNAVWPIFHTQVDQLPSTVSVSDFGEIEVYGQKQTTYKGRPLYYFGGNSSTAGDEANGETRGVSFPSPGVWPIVNTSTESAPTSVQIQTTILGEIMTDSKGRSLYFFTKDTDGTNHCTGGCDLSWPIFYTDDVSFSESSGLVATDFNEIVLTNGNKQTTYKGWPIYYFSPTADGVIESAGEIGGNGINNVWYVAKSNYSLFIADAQLVGHDGLNYTSEYVLGDGISKYFVDGNGRTLYTFSNDTHSNNNFTAEDFSNNGVWPIFHVEIDRLPSCLDAADFGEIDVFGQKQTTYKGWPLYYFGGNASVTGDVERGDNRGISFPSPGVWPIINSTSEEAPQ